MCGIAGYSLNPKDTYINARRLSQALLIGIEERGKDATGAAWRDRNGQIVTQKRAVTATSFVRDLSLDKRASLAVLHTRLWTQGPPTDPYNNHPITAGDIVGVHNGTVGNDEQLLAIAEKGGYVRQGKVDSEAIFATINRVGAGGDGISLVDALEAIEARMALAWIDLTDAHDNTLHLARGEGSPMVIGQTGHGSLIFASTKDAVVAAAQACGIDLPYFQEVQEGTYFKVRDGIIIEQQKFEPTPSWFYSRSWSGGTTSYTGATYAEKQPSIVKEHSTTYLDLRYLDVDIDIPDMTMASFRAANPARHASVTKWLEDHAFIETGDDLTDDHAVFEKAAANGAFLRPGMWVQTPFKGEWCDAQVYRVPKTFPEGDYILRVLVPWFADTDTVYREAIFIARSIFDMDGPALQWEYTPPAGELNPATDDKSIA